MMNKIIFYIGAAALFFLICFTLGLIIFMVGGDDK